MTSPSPTAPKTPAPSLEEVAREAAKLLRRGAQCAEYAGHLGTADDMARGADALERALSAESSREKLRIRLREHAERLIRRDERAAADAPDHSLMAIGLDTADAIRLLLETSR